VKRREYFNYFYIILSSDRRLVGYDIRYLHYTNLLGEFFKHKIGIITVNNQEPFLLYPSNFIKIGLEKIEMKKKYLNSTY
jgi:hypothetical protein